MTDPGFPNRSALAEGRSEAFAELFDRHARWMLAAARAITSSTPDAEDAVQDTFLELHRCREALARAERPRAYLHRAVRNAALRILGRKRERGLEHDPLVEVTHERDEALEHALAKLPEEQREVIMMKTEGELTFEELGEALGVSANTASSRHRLALEKLRTLLGGTR